MKIRNRTLILYIVKTTASKNNPISKSFIKQNKIRFTWTNLIHYKTIVLIIKKFARVFRNKELKQEVDNSSSVSNARRKEEAWVYLNELKQKELKEKQAVEHSSRVCLNKQQQSKKEGGRRKEEGGRRKEEEQSKQQ